MKLKPIIPLIKRKRSKNKTSENVFIVYEISSTMTDKKYVGFTASIGKRGYNVALERRFSAHRSKAKTSDLPLYITMREYGINTFRIRKLRIFADDTLPGVFVEKKAREYEDELIKSGNYVLNSLGMKKI